MEVLHELAGAQHGLVTRAQLIQRGIPPGTVAEWARRGRLGRLHPGVYAVAGSQATDLRALAAAVLAAGAGAVASHRAAAWLWDLADELVLEVTVPRGRRPRLSGVTVHRQNGSHGRASLRRGLPITNPLGTLVDVAAVVTREGTAAMLELALSRRLVSIRGVEAELERRRGCRGAGALRSVLATRALGDRPPDSVLESRMAALITRHRLPRAIYQHTVRVDGRFVARVDFAYPEVRLAIEMDGHDSHRTPADLQRDLARQNLLVGAGWTVLRFTWADVVGCPAEVAATIRRQLSRLHTA